MKTVRKKSFGEFIIKKRLAIIIIFAAATVLSGLGLADFQMSSSLKEWFPKDSPVKKQREAFEEQFQRGETVALLIEAEDVFDPEVLQMIDQLGEDLLKEIPFADELTSITKVEYTFSEYDGIITEELVDTPIPTDKGEIERIRNIAVNHPLMKNRLVSDDSKETWVVLDLFPFPDDWEGEYEKAPYVLVGETMVEILSRPEYVDYGIKYTGAPVFMYDELINANRESSRLIFFCLIIAVLLLVFFLRSFSGVFLPLLSVSVSLIIVFGLSGFFKIKANSFMFTVPVLLSLVVSISYSIHLFNYFKENFNRFGDRKQSVIAAVDTAVMPLLFSALTTSAALISFAVVGLVPLQWLGLTSGTVVFIICGCVLFLTPVLISFGKDKVRKDVAISKETSSGKDQFAQNVGMKSIRNRRSVLIGFVVLFGFLSVGLLNFQVNLNLDETYGFRVEYINKARSIANTKVGAFSFYDITFAGEEMDSVKNPDLLRRFDEFSREVGKLGLTKRTNSLLPLLKEMNKLLHNGDPEHFTIPGSQDLVAQELFLYEMSGGRNLKRWVTPDYSALRLQVDTNDMDSAAMTEQLVVLEELAQQYMPEMTYSITGSMLEYAVMNQMIGIGQIKSFGLALAVIGLLMMIVLKSVKAGLIGLIPNLAPVLAIGGIMGLTGTPLDFLTMTVLPLILGIAVDNTIHFMNHTKVSYLETEDYSSATLGSLGMVGKAMLMTTIVVLFSFGVFSISKYNLFRNLGVFMAIGLGTAYLTSITIAPIMVVIFKPYSKKRDLLYQTE